MGSSVFCIKKDLTSIYFFFFKVSILYWYLLSRCGVLIYGVANKAIIEALQKQQIFLEHIYLKNVTKVEASEVKIN